MHTVRHRVADVLAGTVLACLGAGLGGCAALLVGGGAVGGYALLSRDAVWNEFDLPKERIYRESLAVIEELGMVTTADEAHGIIEAKVDDANVTVTVTELTRRTVQLKVKARSPLKMPAIDVAQRTYNAIIERLYV